MVRESLGTVIFKTNTATQNGPRKLRYLKLTRVTIRFPFLTSNWSRNLKKNLKLIRLTSRLPQKEIPEVENVDEPASHIGVQLVEEIEEPEVENGHQPVPDIIVDLTQRKNNEE